MDAAATGSCAERWSFSAEELINARRSAFVELKLEARKASWPGVEEFREDSRVDLHPTLVGDMREGFHAMPDDRAVFESHRPSYSPSLPGAPCLEVFGRNHWKSSGKRAKRISWDCAMLVGLLNV